MTTPKNKRAILLNVPRDVYDTIAAAAAAELRPVTQYVLFHALREANASVAQVAARAGIRPRSAAMPANFDCPTCDQVDAIESKGGAL
jgi:hypothetical protein